LKFFPEAAEGAGGPALDQFDLLSALVDWVQKANASHVCTFDGKSVPWKKPPLCAYPKHTQYKGQGDTQDAKNFECC
jgi:hypothetical protein